MASRSSIAQITDSLYLCGATAITQQRLVRHGITHVINSTKDVPTFNVPGIQTTRINVDDHPYARLDAHFDRVADAISHVCSRGGKVLVLCVVGVSRSATLCIVYLMKYHKLTLVQAHEYVRKRRPIIRPNSGFWRQLIEYERKLYGRTTVRMVNSIAGPIPDVYKELARFMI
jgi:protein-tyrosine phosphatase